MREKIAGIPAAVLALIKKIGRAIKGLFYKIFPRRAAKYFDADLHEVKYVALMAVYALAINLYIESFARVTTAPLEGIRWAFTNLPIFLFNTLIIFCSMTLALLFKKRRFVWFIISLIWIIESAEQEHLTV